MSVSDNVKHDCLEYCNDVFALINDEAQKENYCTRCFISMMAMLCVVNLAYLRADDAKDGDVHDEIDNATSTLNEACKSVELAVYEHTPNNKLH